MNDEVARIEAWQRRNIGKDGTPWSSWYLTDDAPSFENTQWDGVYSYEYRALYAAQQVSPLRVTGAINLVEEATFMIWSELCPDMVMGDDDIPHYEAAAKAVLALAAREVALGTSSASGHTMLSSTDRTTP